MANYPSFLTLSDSASRNVNGMEPERATNGALKLRRMWSADKARFDVGHLLSSAQKSTLDSFYATNKDLDVTYRWPGTGATYTVRFTEPPVYTPRGMYFEARIRMEEA